MVKMVIGEVQAQTSEVKSYCNKMIQNLENVSNATSSIGLAVGLQGQAFQSIKSYLSTAYPALAKALILYSESVATANENYLQAYTGKFGAKDLDSDKLQHQIEEKNRLLQGLHEQKESVESFQRNLPTSTEVFFRAVCREMIQTLSSSINRNMAAKNKLEKKLEDFLEFNSHSPSYFEEANSLYGTVNSALSSLGVGKDGQISTGSWNEHGFRSFSNGWISEVNKKWEKREVVLHDLLEKEKQKNLNLLNGYDIECFNSFEDTYWYVLKNGKRLNRKDYPDLYQALDSCKDYSNEDRFFITEMEINKFEIPLSPIFGGEGRMIVKLVKGIHTIKIGESIIQSIKKAPVFINSEQEENLDTVISEGKKTKKHKVITDDESSSLKAEGEPNSSADLLNPDGSVKQRRYYGEDGKAIEDIDYNHSDDGTHKFPHRHKWDWNKIPPRQ